MNLEQVASQLYQSEKNIILVYAFNATGKTRLSVAYKNASKNDESGEHEGVYYNAFSEDLFVWDNDTDNHEQNIKLEIRRSSLNRLHSSITEDDINAKLAPYQPRYDFYFSTNKDPELGIDAVTFYVKGDNKTPIKISRGEERIFVWCLLLALFEVEGWADKQSKHFFIDDPVSSLDDNNIFITAFTLFELIDKHFKDRKIIITTHHLGLFSILSDWITKGEKASQFKERNNNKYQMYILSRDADELSLESTRNDVLLYHLQLMKLLQQAKEGQLYTYHFALLRQALENIASFLGVGQFSYVLEQIGIADKDRVATIVNTLSHQRIYYHQSDIMQPDNKSTFIDIFDGLMEKYKFVLHAE